VSAVPAVRSLLASCALSPSACSPATPTTASYTLSLHDALPISALVVELGVAQMAHVATFDHVDHVFGHVLGVVADALQRLGHEQHLQATADRARVLHHERDQLPQNGAELDVHRLILLHHA